MKRFKFSTVVLCCLSGWPILASDGVDWVDFFARVINTGIFAFILYYLLKEPVRDFFSKRAKGIQENLKAAETAKTEAESRLQEIELRMANLEAELEDIERQAREEAAREKQRIKEQAALEAERMLASARTEIENTRRQAVHALRVFVADLALDQAREQLGTQLSEAHQQRLFEAFTNELGVKS